MRAIDDVWGPLFKLLDELGHHLGALRKRSAEIAAASARLDAECDQRLSGT
ncbi:MAG: hypothetical protein ABI467_13095 [Kofleriaceae bacterium]